MRTQITLPKVITILNLLYLVSTTNDVALFVWTVGVPPSPGPQVVPLDLATYILLPDLLVLPVPL